MFELNKKELGNLRSQNVISSWGGNRYLPFAFTEQGVAMLSSVLKSKKAVEVNIAIMRAFVLLRQHLTDYNDLKQKIEELEKEMNLKFEDINQALHYLLKKDKAMLKQQTRRQIGYQQKRKKK